jgi:hypothetical protein
MQWRFAREALRSPELGVSRFTYDPGARMPWGTGIACRKRSMSWSPGPVGPSSMTRSSSSLCGMSFVLPLQSCARSKLAQRVST